MVKDRAQLQKIGYVALATLFVFSVAYVWTKGQRTPAPLTIERLTSNAGSPSTPEPAPTPKPEAKEVVVHVTGAVKKPGLLHLPPDSRVDDAIKAAGGSTDDADLEAINLAAKLADGSQVPVPRKGIVAEVPEPYATNADTYSSHPGSKEPGTRSGGKKHPSGQVSLNTGSASQLQGLPGVGPSTAQKILQYRMEHGGFSSIDELMAVKGIGPKKLSAMRKFLRL